jgi:four helix bundle protein
MSKIESHRDLLVWQKAMDLGVLIYDLSAKFPRTETYRLVDQITRSVASIPANIAEGRGRATKREYAHFLSVARGSLMETDTYVMFAIRLRYTTATETQSIFDLITEISKMLTVLRARLLEDDEA